MIRRIAFEWKQVVPLPPLRFKCGYCGTDTTPAFGYASDRDPWHNQGFIAICTCCNRPVFIETLGSRITQTTPSAAPGDDIDGLPDDVKELYTQARKSFSVQSSTSSVLTCRKILMHTAVEKGAPPNQKFIQYVEFLSANNYVPPDGKEWVDHIRNKGNEANHEILLMGKEDAEDLITFVEMLLRLVYEFKKRLPKKDAKP